MADNLVQKKGESTWYVRLAVPADVQSKLKTKVLVQSLKTGLRKEAMERRLPILTEWKQRIRTAREGIPLPEGWQDEIISLKDDIGLMFQNLKLELVGVEAPTPPEIDPVIEARMRNNPQLVAAFQRLVQVHLKDGLAGKVRLIDEMSKGFQSMIPKLYTRSFNLPITQQAEVNAVLFHPNQHKSKSPITSARIKTYREFRESRGGAAKHIDQQVGKMERLSAFLKKGENLPNPLTETWTYVFGR